MEISQMNGHELRALAVLQALGIIDPRYKEDPHRWKRYTLRTLYGITLEAYNEMLEAQGGVCAICQSESNRMLDTDHCHETGEVRGLLCNGCNQGLGQFKDSPKRLQNAIDYLS